MAMVKNPEEWFAYGGITSSNGTVGAMQFQIRKARAGEGQ
jgi:hypothetical protein